MHLSVIVLYFILHCTHSTLLNPQLKVLSISTCNYDPQEGYKVYTNLKSLPNGEKALDADIFLPRNFTENFKFELLFSKRVGITYLNNIYKEQGSICEYVPLYYDKIWRKIAAATNPPVNLRCPIEAGRYTLRNFQAESSDVKVPMFLRGRFKIELRILYEGKVVMCKLMELRNS